MQQITEQQITSWAPNASAVANARKISRSGGFVRLERSDDDSFYLGECKGSGSSNYITSVDFIEPSAPVFRCSCPSRQFPCKHSLALLYEIMGKKKFDICKVPEDIEKKRAKKIAKDLAKEQKELSKDSSEEPEHMQAQKESTKISKSAKAARAKKIKKQLEGLDLLEKMMKNLLQMGLGTMGGSSLAMYRDLSKQLGDYYLPGPQRLLNGLILQMESFQRDGQENHYDAAIDILKKMWSLIKQSRKYLTELLEGETLEQDYNPLYEELGGIWKMTELASLGGVKENVSLVQLSFWVSYDATRREFIDTGCWVDLDTGELYMTYNYRPLKALKYVKEEDSMFQKLEIVQLVRYPGEGNPRVRWENPDFAAVTAEDLQKIRSYAATSLKMEVKNAKNLLKNPLSPSMWIRLIHYDMIGSVNGEMVLRTKDKDTIVLRDSSNLEPTVAKLTSLSNRELFCEQVMVGAFFYDAKQKRLLMQPLGIVTKKGIIRLLY